jgi:transcriptional regulator with XRE-family HTH domain
MPAPRDRDSLRIGPRLRAIRRERGLSLRALAERTEFSASFLSQAELGQVSPSLGSLERIATALGTSLAGLLSPARERRGPLIQGRGAPRLRSEWSRATVQSLLPAGTDERVELIRITLERAGRTGKHLRPDASQQLAFCVRGRIAVEVGPTRYELDEGESILFDAGEPVVCRNDGRAMAELLLLTLRPPRRERRS